MTAPADLARKIVLRAGVRALCCAVADDPTVVARPRDHHRIARVLRELGFVAKGRSWARFRAWSAEVVDLVGTNELDLPEPEVDRLLGPPAPGGAPELVCPALDDQLWLAARLWRPGGGPVPPGRRAAVHGLLARDPSAWLRAYHRAAKFGHGDALVRVQDAFETGVAPKGEAEGRRGAIVALSGLDGSGKSTQAHALAATLHRLGYEPAVEWTRVGYDARLERLSTPVKRLATARWRGRPSGPGPDTRRTADRPARAPSLRDRSPLVDRAWTTVVALSNAAEQRGSSTRHVRAGRVVIRDRYVLDSRVHLRLKYGVRVDGDPALSLVTRLSPTPLCAFFLDVMPETAHRRKPEEFSVSELAEHARLYRRECAALGVLRLDGGRPPAEIAARIASEVWRRLP